MSNAERLRAGVLYSALMVVFGSAWVADYSPNLALPAILVACTAVLGEIGLLYFLARQSGKETSATTYENCSNLDLDVHSLDEAAIYNAKWLEALPAIYAFRGNKRAFSSVITIWALESATRNFSSSVAPQSELAERSSGLTNWKLTMHGREAFDIEAGAFRIEHFHGHTNIRVTNSSAVTVVDDDKQNHGILEIPLGIMAPNYN